MFKERKKEYVDAMNKDELTLIDNKFFSPFAHLHIYSINSINSTTTARATPRKPPATTHHDVPSPSPSRPPTKSRPIVLTVAAVAMFSLSAYASYLYTTYRQAASSSPSSIPDHDVSDRYRTTAPSYDSDVDMAERMMRMGKRRRDLVRKARGDVLEVSVGTGRNIPYYMLGERRGVDKDGRASVLGCRSVTFVDLWGEMVDIARWKYEEFGSNKEKGRARVVFLAQDAMAPVSPPINAGSKENKKKFDTVVQTMGLCSHPDPVKLLRHLGTVTEEDGGRILLLEHGRGHYAWVNRLLDDLAPAHADRHGCWWNRDIGDIVRASGLVVLEARRYHLGTTWEYVLRPRKAEEGEAASSAAEDDRSTAAPGSDASTTASTGTDGWLVWKKG
ncbi:oxa1 multicopy suppressor [Arthroderma uncinatum]|uniref:oxa1 multicopy suppressor n=1 Tax=Arthroderma uncinatum TaxID=74035 RepID=UPI00144A955A|nr:oxa1 multicopy suppressor [Arthroderma uncinatum]KAF3491506.1 oxa1 multicopy suppressor [Arthroderma uncinatum]